MYDITSIGEILIDLTQTGTDENGIAQFAANPGGAPANLAVAAARLGARTAFIGRVGQDRFGDLLRRCLLDNHVDVSALQTDAQHHTTLAVVTVDDHGERDFSFYRQPGADVLLDESAIPLDLLTQSRFVHFGSVSLTDAPSRSATLHSVKRARAAGACITFDPNYRAPLWAQADDAVRQIRAALPLCHILKVSDEELLLLTGTRDLPEGTRLLQAQGPQLILVTLGADGAFYRLGEATGHVAGVPCIVQDTNGAGDTFFGALLSRLCHEASIEALSPSDLEAAIAFANRAASITTSRRGAIPAMPTLAEVAHLSSRSPCKACQDTV